MTRRLTDIPEAEWQLQGGRIAQSSLGFSGAFCHTSLPLFQGELERGLLEHSMMDLYLLSRPARFADRARRAKA
jgi:hypothetical protein